MPPDRWVNAVVELTFPLDDVQVGDPARFKQEAFERMIVQVVACCRFDTGLSESAVTGRWEDVEDGEPIPCGCGATGPHAGHTHQSAPCKPGGGEPIKEDG